jgi:glutamate dehydrogenase/leucine dehydrogenase
MVRELSLEAGGLSAHLCIDRLVAGGSFGGLRIVAPASLEETRACARVMSRKFAFWGLPHGGAKAWMEPPPPGAPPGLRREALVELGARLSDVVASGRWLPGIDMGSSMEDLRALHEGAGHEAELGRWRDRSHLHTAWSVLEAARAALRFRGKALRGARVAVQGLGRVGTELVGRLAAEGALVVAVSEVDGTHQAEGGLDVPALLAGRGIPSGPGGWQGDRSPEAIVSVEADVLFPCARALALRAEHAGRLRADAIVPAANWALSDEDAEEIHRAGVLVVPDFVANGGGVFGSFVEGHLSEAALRRFFAGPFAEHVERLLAGALREGESPAARARAAVDRRLAEGFGGSRARLAAAGRHVLPALPGAVRDAVLSAWLRRRALVPLRS